MQDLRADPRSTSELFDLALHAGEEEAWAAIAILHRRGTRDVFERAQDLARSVEPAARGRAADILAQLGVPERTFLEECFSLLAGMLSDPSEVVISSAIMGLSHLDAERAAPLVAPFAVHSSEEVRYAVAQNLGLVNTEVATGVLLGLMEDEDGDVRDWATLGVGSLRAADTPQIRTALVARLADSHDGARFEAVCGLACRGDRRAIPELRAMLTLDPENTFLREAASGLIGDLAAEKLPLTSILARLDDGCVG